MAQKTNPISLRLKVNRRFDSFWWSSFFYSDLFGRDLKIRKHFQKVFRQSKKRSLTRIGYTGNSKEQKVLLYWARPMKVERRNKPSFWRRRRNTMDIQDLSSFYSFPTQGSSILDSPSVRNIQDPRLQEKGKILRLLGLFYSSTLISPKEKKEIYTKILEILSNKGNLSPSSKFFSDYELQDAFKEVKRLKAKRSNPKAQKKSSPQKPLKDVREKLLRSLKNSVKNKLEKNIRQTFHLQSSVSPSILKTPYLSAEGISEVIKDGLRKRIFFKRIFGNIKRETHHLLKGGEIKGIRILLSGRLGRQEKAKKESLYIGRTSLNTFSQQIDYSCTSALTRYGQIGIKVWISF
uniref:Small ribosomal subunit protein uS3m n=1 Tax=Chloropicon sieburthii TaxID=1764286 RepID=A0A4D6C4T4_9CHLO|nr:ribosomal protein S3 [Chloropicon sieburthii]QBX98650.1 ribosomal protein S3 [Chloropicon sieburthii]